MSAAPAPRLVATQPSGQIEFDVLLAALPHPILVLGENNSVVYVNASAESFLSTSASVLKRARLDDVLAFGCPLLSLLEQVRQTSSTVNEYGIELASPKFAVPKLTDVYAGPFPDHSGYIILILQQRTMAQMIERQL